MSEPFQRRIDAWVKACFGDEIACDKVERRHRFLEEALELFQACGADRKEAFDLVDYVFDRPIGDPQQETGGVLLTLAALCTPHEIDMLAAGEAELLRVWGKV